MEREYFLERQRQGGIAAQTPQAARGDRAHLALELQRAVGNRAATSVLQRKEALPTATDRRAELDKKLSKRAAKLKKDLGKEIRERARLEAKSVEQGLTAAEKKRLGRLDEKLKPYEEVLDDLVLVRDPNTSAAALADALARNRRQGDTAEVVETGYRTTTTSSVTKGVSSVSTTSDSDELDATELKYTRTRDEQSSLVKGDDKLTWGEKTSTSFSAKDLAFTKEVEKTRARGEDRSSSTTTSTTVGLGGASQTTSKEKVRGDKKTTSEDSRGVELGGGAVTFKRGEKRGDLKVDAKGDVVGGTQTSSDVSGKVIIGGNRLGGGLKGDLGADVFGKGGKKGTFKCGGEATADVQITEIPNTDRFKVVLTIKLGVSAGAGASKAKKGPSSRDASASLGGSVSRTLVFTHELTAYESLAYKAQLGLAADGKVEDGRYPELAVMATATEHGADMAKAVVFGAASSFGSAGGALALAEGASMEVIDQAGVEVKGSGGAKGGGASGSVTAGYSASGKRRMVIAKKGGKIAVTLAISTDDAISGGASAGFSGVSGGVSGKATTDSARVVKVTIDPARADFPTLMTALSGVRTRAQLDEVVKQTGVKLDVDTRSEGRSGKLDTEMGLAAGKLTIGQGTFGSHSVTKEGDKTTETYVGGNELSASLSVADKTVASSSTKDTFTGSLTTETGATTATGDVSTERKRLDQGATAAAFVKGIQNDPIGMLTGAVEYTKETTDIRGMKLSNADIDLIAKLAADRNKWDRAGVHSISAFEDWRGVRMWVMQEGQTRESVIQGLAAFLESTGGNRRETVERLLKPIEGGDRGGARYEQAEGMDDLSAYAKLIGPESASATVEEYDALIKTIMANEAKFRDPPVMVEMVRKLTDRRAEKIGTPQARYDGLVATCKAAFYAERRMTDAIEAQFEQYDWLYFRKKPDLKVILPLYNRWDRMNDMWEAARKELQELVDQHGFPQGPLHSFKPNRGYYTNLRAKAGGRIQG